MFSVTQRIKMVKQPRGGYINQKDFKVTDLCGSDLFSQENIPPNIIGIVVDYLTRYMSGTSKEDAFRISILGAAKIEGKNYAKELLDNVIGLDDKSIDCASKLAGYDVCFRAGINNPVGDIEPDINTISNIRNMVNRSLNFMKIYGPITLNGFTFKGGYTDLVSSGDGDYLTETTLWEFKVSRNNPTKDYTLQLLMYYIMGMHSIHEEFRTIKNLGIFNPRLNRVYLLPINNIDSTIIEEVSSKVIGYTLPGCERNYDENWTKPSHTFKNPPGGRNYF